MNKAEVYLWGSKIGYVILNKDGSVEFEYTKEFIKSNIQLSPIKMPLSEEVYSFPELVRTSFKGAPGLIADSLPDKFGNAVLEAWLEKNGRNKEEVNVIERLCYTGTRGMGALEYKPCYQDEKNVSLELDSMVELAGEILSNREQVRIDSDKDDAMSKLFSIGSSAGGARAKAIIAWNKEKNLIVSGQINAGPGFEYYIVKFDGVDSNGDHGLKDGLDYTKIEFSYYQMALKAGIKMMDSFLFEEHGRYHFFTKRFDRINNQKIHSQTFGSLMHIDYNEPGVSSYEELMRTAKKIGCESKDIEMIYRIMVFNSLAYNFDDHVKNFTFLMNKEGKWSLSPAYDITFSYDKNNKWLKAHQMRINGKILDINEQDFFDVAKSVNISKQKANKIIDEVKLAISKWKTIAKENNVSSEWIDYIATFINK